VVTALFTSLASNAQSLEQAESMISSLMDAWIVMAIEQVGAKRSRKVTVLKSRGMPHSDEVHDFRFSSKGIDILPSTLAPAPLAASTAAPRKKK
jgi:circadian clock protein KaiC